MAVKKAIYKVDNGSGFDEIHFKTSAEQVICSKFLDENNGYLELPGGVIMQWAATKMTITKHNGQHWAGMAILPKGVDVIIGSSYSIVSASVVQGEPTSDLIGNIDFKLETKVQSGIVRSRVYAVWGGEDKDANTSIEVKVRVLVWGYKNEYTRSNRE